MGMGGGQLMIILVIIGIVFFLGPGRIPSLGKSLGQAIRGFKKGLSEDEVDVTNSVERQQIDEGQSTKASQAQKNSDKV